MTEQKDDRANTLYLLSRVFESFDDKPDRWRLTRAAFFKQYAPELNQSEVVRMLKPRIKIGDSDLAKKMFDVVQRCL
ncbi:MAG TPA: hypothetical protein VKP88_06515, partial [Candidatus Paceibacterota bacterium]|nr:hypothetical protein [Candidatus Paceibacterota bacterium]